MDPKLVASIILLVIVGSAAVYFVVLSNVSSESEIACPKDGSPYVLTPIGSRSENFNWRCLQCDYCWRKTYPEDVYQRWRKAFLEPPFVRDYTLLYLRKVLQLNISDSLPMNWAGGKETPTGLVGCEVYIYRVEDIVVTIKYPVVLPENTVYEIKVEVQGATLWEGSLYRRQFVTSIPTPPVGAEFRAVYDCYGGVGLFEKGIHIIATSMDPSDFATVNDYWRLLKENETLKASTEDFISIIISRGDYPTGGYTIQVKSFGWLETYPTTFLFAVNFTDPGEGVIVTEAFTNPLVLVHIGNLSAGKYVVEVHICRFILTYEAGKPVYTPVQTPVEAVWKESFEVIEDDGSNRVPSQPQLSAWLSVEFLKRCPGHCMRAFKPH